MNIGERERLVKLEGNIEQLVMAMKHFKEMQEVHHQEVSDDLNEMKIIRREMYDRINNLTEAVAENKVAKNIGKAVLFLAASSGVAYIIKHLGS